MSCCRRSGYEEIGDPNRAVELFKERGFSSRGFKRAWRILDAGGKQGTLEQLGREVDPRIFKRVIENVPVEDMLTAANLSAQELNQSTQYFLQFALEHANTSTDNKRFASVSPRAIDNILLAFDYFSANHEPTSPWEAMAQLQVYAVLFIGPMFIASVIDSSLSLEKVTEYHNLVSLVGVVTFLAGFFGGIKIYQHFKPIPSQIKPLRNYTLEVVKGNLDPLVGRDTIIDQIFMSWQSSNRTTRMHPLLVGPPGVGKTTIMMEVARRIAIGQVPEKLKKEMEGKQLFGGPAALLLPTNPAMETDDKIDRILRRIEPFKNDVILGLDEVHSFLTDQWVGRYGEVLKSMLDVSFKGLPYMICATTEDEYKKYIAVDGARARRFQVIYVEALTKAESVLILRDLVTKQYSDIDVSDEMLDLIYEKSEGLAAEFDYLRQPEISKRILSTCLSKLKTDTESLKFSRELFETRLQLTQYRSVDPFLTGEQGREIPSNDVITRRAGEIRQIESEIAEKEREEEEHQGKILELQQAQKNLDDEKNNIYQVVVDLDLEKKDSKKEQLKKKFIFSSYFVLPSIKRKISDLQAGLALPNLSEGLIDETIAGFRESLEKAKGDEHSDDEDLFG